MGLVIASPAATCVIPAAAKAAHLLDNTAAGRGCVPDAALQKRMARCLEAL